MLLVGVTSGIDVGPNLNLTTVPVPGDSAPFTWPAHGLYQQGEELLFWKGGGLNMQSKKTWTCAPPRYVLTCLKKGSPKHPSPPGVCSMCGQTKARFRFGPASSPMWREDIANATDWRYVEVDVEPNLNLANLAHRHAWVNPRPPLEPLSGSALYGGTTCYVSC